MPRGAATPSIQEPVEPTADSSESKTVAAVERAADVLLYFGQASANDLGVTDIAHALGLSKAAVHRLLSSLRTRELVTVDPVTRRYSMGPGALILGLSALNRLDVRRLAIAELAAISADTGETATLSIRSTEHRIYIDQVTPSREVIMSVRIGQPYPLHAGASSKAFLAFLGEDEIKRYLDVPLEKLTTATVVSRRALLKELRDIAARGWAASVGERQEGAASVAAPVLDHQGRPVAVISVCGPAGRFVPGTAGYADRLLRSTRELSTQLGYRG